MVAAFLDNKLANKHVALLEKELERQKKRVRLGSAIALTKTAVRAQAAIKKEMASVFDRPTRWTLNATYVQPAKKYNKDQAKVGLKDGRYVKRGVAPVNHLFPEIHGKKRQAKRHEAALEAVGVLPHGYRIVPGSGAEIDRFGNMKAGQIRKILAYFQGGEHIGDQRFSGFSGNTTDDKKRRMRKATNRRAGISYFVASRSDRRTKHLQPGVYMKRHSALGTAIKPVMIFVKAAVYKPRLDFYGIANEVFDEWIDYELDTAVAFLKTPKRS